MRARALWIVVSGLLVVGLAAWSTTCTGPRPQPTGQTVPVTDVSPTSPSVPSTGP